VADLRRTALIVGAGAGIAGDGLFLTALAWSVLQATGSPQQLSLVLIVLTVVPLITAPLAGQLVDRARAPDYLVGSEWLAAVVLAAAAGWLSVFTPGLPFFLLGVGFGLLAASRTVPFALGAVLLAGVALSLTAMISDTRLVTEIPAAVQGRVMGLLIGMAGAMRPAGTLAGGVVAGALGAAAATGIGAAALAVLGGWYALRRPAGSPPGGHAGNIMPAVSGSRRRQDNDHDV